MINPFTRKYSTEELTLILELNEVNIFKTLQKHELRQIAQNVYERRYIRDEVVFFTGDPSMAMYKIKKGRIAINLVRGDDFEWLNELSMGSTFGENCVIPEARRTYTAIVSSSEAILQVIPSSNILAVLDRFPTIKSKVYESLATLMDRRERKMMSAYRKTYGFFEISEAFRDIY